MRKTKKRLLPLLLAVLLCFAALSTPALAFSDEDGEDKVLEYWSQGSTPPQDTQQPDQQTAPAETTAPAAGEPLSVGSEFSTRDLLYDKETHKQFITVEGRDGNIFYIVIDYDAPVNEDEEQYTTYFLNKVDEADLAALVEQGEPAACACTEKCHAGAVNTACPVCSVNMTECVGKETEPEKPEEPAEPDADSEPEPEKKSGINVNGMLAVVLVVALAGGGAVYFLKFKKKKPDTKGSADLEDYDYGDEEDEYEDDGDGMDNEGDE